MPQALISDFFGVLLSPSGILNHELLAFYRSFGAKLPLYIFTNSNLAQQPALLNQLQLDPQTIFTAPALNLPKTDPASYFRLAALLRLAPTQLVYIDDQNHNVRAAAQAGSSAFLYQNNAQIQIALKELLLK